MFSELLMHMYKTSIHRLFTKIFAQTFLLLLYGLNPAFATYQRKKQCLNLMA